jgi:hypothetical protein
MNKTRQRAKCTATAKLGLVALALSIPLIFSSRAHAAEGDLFVTDLETNSIVVYSPDGTQRVFATGLDSPQGLAFDPVGNLYVADGGSGNIYKYTADASRTTFATGLNGPVGLAYSSLSNDLVVAENGGDQVTSLAADGTVDTTFPIASPLGLAIRNLAKSSDITPVNTTWAVSNPDPADSFLQERIDGSSINTFLEMLDPRGIAFTANPIPTDYASAYVSTGDGMGSVYAIGTTDDGMGNLTNTVDLFASDLGDPRGMAFRRMAFDPAGYATLFVADTSNSQIWQITPPPNKSQTVFVTGGQPNYLAFETILAGKAENISTRGQVLTGENVLIVGFIVTGDAGTEKTVVLRGLGPSLADATPPVAGALADPFLELHYPDGTVVSNDNWMDNSAQDIATLEGLDGGALVPTSAAESVLVTTLVPGAYTAILSGVGGSTGVGMVEAYDTNPTDSGEFGNISTRGYVSGGDDVLIGGFILGPDDEADRILVRAIGPELTSAGIASALLDPMLDLYDGNGNLLKSNDNWADTAEGEISATGIAPTDPSESAILANLRAGAYTAIVSGVNGATGVALVEVYHVP